MFARIATALVIVASLLVGTVAGAQEQTVPVIKTFADYQVVKNTAWKKYSDTKDSAWKKYDAIERTALTKFRTADYENYLKWLDAREMRDYGLLSKLEATAAAEYRKVAKEAWTIFTAADENAFAVFDQADKAAFDAYQQATAKK